MRSIPLIRAAAFFPLASFFEYLGAPTESYWAKARLPVRHLYEPDSAVPLLLGVRFMEDAARGEGIEHLGLVAARHGGVESLGLRGRHLRDSVTLFDAIQGTFRHQPSWNSGSRFWMSAEGPRVRLTQRSVSRLVPSRQADLSTLELILQVMRAAAGPDWRPDRIDLQSQGAWAIPNGDPLSGIEIRTGRSGLSFAFPRALLSRRLSWPDRQEAADAAPAPAAGSFAPFSLDFVQSARAVIAMLLASGAADVETAAEAAGSSLRSFQRRLAERGVSFSRLVDETRFDVARRLLDDPTVKIIDVAYAAGYSDPAHFTRAFRRWTASSPIEYRRHSGSEEHARQSA